MKEARNCWRGKPKRGKTAGDALDHQSTNMTFEAGVTIVADYNDDDGTQNT